MQCIEDGCARPVKVKVRQLCNAHYIRAQRAGTLVPIDRFSTLINTSGDCWEWMGKRDQGGYGRFGTRSAHRLSWERANGPIPPGMTIDHRCRNRACVRPAHLRLMTPSANFSDNGFRDRTHCKNGHEFTPENTRTRVRFGRSHRVCITCDRGHQRRYAAKRRAT